MNNEAKLTIDDIQMPPQIEMAISKWWNSTANLENRECSSAEATIRLDAAYTAIRVALLALANEPVPCDGDQEIGMWGECEGLGSEQRKMMRYGAVEWQRRMFLKSEPEVPAIQGEWPESTCVECGRKIPSGQQQDCIGGGQCSWRVPDAIRKAMMLGKRLGSAKGGQQ